MDAALALAAAYQSELLSLPELHDVSAHTTLSELDALLKRDNTAMRLTLARCRPLTDIHVTVNASSAVRDLKRTLEPHLLGGIADAEMRRRMSIKYIWRAYGLEVTRGAVRLDKDAQRLSEYGVGDGSTLSFYRKRRIKRRDRTMRGRV
ncbi:U11/U12 small nuclear ribonucleoprotein [Sorochytrium milnesiophthora]